MKKTFALSLLIISSTILTAQVNIKKCLTTPLVQQELLSNPDYVKGRAQSIAENSAWIAGNHNKKSTLDIPVVVHVVHRLSHVNVGTGTNISDAQIADALRILNEDYSKTNPEFPNPPRNTFVAYAGNPDLQFCLATTDPNGNPTTGITRTSSIKNSFDTDTESDDMKKDVTDGKDGWDPSRYLNIWVCNLSTSGGGMILGYAYLPGLWASQQWKDGLVVDYQYFGTVGAGSSGGNDGRTPTHEIGHYLGLKHTFCESQSGGCCDNDNNSSGGYVDDTPASDGPYYGSVTATTNNNTCNDLSYSNIFTTDVLDMDENYMSYASNTWMFSVDQVNVMDATLNGYRSSLQNSTVSMNCTAVTPSWDCNNWICSDPGTGQGAYTSLVACQSNCILPSWDCNNGVCYDPGTGNGQYSTSTACASACVTPTWDCTGNTCADPGTGQGAYTSLAACQSNCPATAINEEISDLLIYPNPAKNTLTIDGNYTSVTIYDVFGKVVLATDYQKTIGVAALSSGIYFIRINTDKGTRIEKIMLSK